MAVVIEQVDADELLSRRRGLALDQILHTAGLEADQVVDDAEKDRAERVEHLLDWYGQQVAEQIRDWFLAGGAEQLRELVLADGTEQQPRRQKRRPAKAEPEKESASSAA